MKQLIFIIIFSVIGAVVTKELIEFNRLKRAINNIIDVYPRMTAIDGQELCIRIQNLERLNKTVVKPCSYY